MRFLWFLFLPLIASAQLATTPSGGVMWYKAPVVAAASWTNVTRGLANQWKFTEGTGTSTADNIGSANGTLTPGVGGGSFDWRNDGGISSIGTHPATDAKIQLSANTSPGAGAMSVSLWFCQSNAPITAGNFIVDYSAGASDLGYSFYMDDSTHLGAIFGSTSIDAMRLCVIPPPPTNIWIHLAVTWNGTINPATGIHIYTNGVENSDYSSTSGFGSYGGPNNTTTRNLAGNAGPQRNTGCWGGYDDIRVYNVELNSTELSHLYNYGRQ